MKRAGARALGVLLAVAVFAPREVAAMGAIIGPKDAPVAIASLRVAVAVAEGRTTRWAQVTSTPTTEGFGWLVPVLPGARVDLASDAWLDALDAATVPVVLPPLVPPTCDVSLAPDIDAATTSPSSQSPGQALVALDVTSLTSFVANAGLAIPSELSPALGSVFTSGGAVLALVFGPSALPLHSLRIVDTGPAVLPFALSGNAASPVEVTTFLIGSSEIEATLPSLVLAPSSLLWLSTGGSNYTSDVASLLLASGGSRWMVQSAAPSPFFATTPIAPSLALPSVLHAYYGLASKYRDTMADPDACEASAVATRGATSSYASACPAGSLAVVPGPSPCIAQPGGETSIDGLVCGASVDAALAVAALSPPSVWVTRMAGVVTEASASDVALVSAGVIPVSSLLTASGYDGICAAAGSGDGGTEDVWDGGADDDDGGGDDGGGWNDDGGLGGGDASWASGFGGGDAGLAAVASAVSDGCGSSSTADDDSSGGCDSSSTSDDSSGCSGDSSGSSDSGGCSGGSSSSSNNSCTTARRGRPTRSPVSRILISLAFGLGSLRRLRRRRAVSR